MVQGLRVDTERARRRRGIIADYRSFFCSLFLDPSLIWLIYTKAFRLYDIRLLRIN